MSSADKIPRLHVYYVSYHAIGQLDRIAFIVTPPTCIGNINYVQMEQGYIDPFESVLNMIEQENTIGKLSLPSTLSSYLPSCCVYPPK